MENVFDESLTKLLGAVSAPAAIRSVEAGRGIEAMWSEFEGSGFLDALVPEARGGAGLSLAEARGLFFLSGRYAVPAPFAATAMFRGLATSLGLSAPEGPIAIAPGGPRGAALTARDVPFGMVARWVLVPLGEGAVLMPAAAANREPTGVHGALRANFVWPDAGAAVMTFPASMPWMEAGALIGAGVIAGGLDYLLADTVRHVNARAQFGRSIGKFQAVQQQMSVLAGRTHAARMAFELGCEGGGVLPDRARVAVAKIYASQAAPLGAAIAHALHGAIGMTGEYDLQLYTRRLHEARADYGSELFWSRRLGRSLVEAEGLSTLDFMLERLV